MESAVGETERVRERYERRKLVPSRGSPRLNRLVSDLDSRDLGAALFRWVRVCGIEPVEEKRVLDVGCGAGISLQPFLDLGFRPENLVGSELLEERVDAARRNLPQAVRVVPGDALRLPLELGPFDVVHQAMVFTSLLDRTYQRQLADHLWRLTRPGGGVLWYDFIYNNPRNPDVRGVPLKEVLGLFPDARLRVWRVTLAPPISRCVVRLHPGLYHVLNALPLLRTHVLCWLRKPP